MPVSAARGPTSPAPAPGSVVRHDWTVDEIRALHDLPLQELVYRAQTTHRATFGDPTVQLCALLSVKTGGCSEDCGYCPQAARHDTDVRSQGWMPVPEVLTAAREAREKGATRFCMGAAWREVREGPQFDSVLEMVRGVRALGMEACCTLGMLNDSQARRLKEAGLSAYNHNLDTSPEHYGKVITTRTYQDRLDTIQRVRGAGISVCCGGILGLGESVTDRCALLQALANQEAHPESVPINTLVAVDGTPLADASQVDGLDLVRVIATARLLMPYAKVRLSAGRLALTDEAQVLCFMAGANSIFFGDKLLTTGNPSYADDVALLARAGLRPMPLNEASHDPRSA